MNNINIRKRRGYPAEDSSSDPMFQNFPPPSQFAFNSVPLFPNQSEYIPIPDPSTQVTITISLDRLLNLGDQQNQQYILQQVANGVHQPLPDLLGLTNAPGPVHKRPRLNTDFSMPMSYSNGRSGQDTKEKAPFASSSNVGSHTGRKAFGFFPDDGIPSGWTSSRLAECFASFTMCQPCSPFDSSPAYQPILTPPSYDFDDAGSASTNAVTAALTSQNPASLASAPLTIAASPAQLYPCDTSLLLDAYLPNYPPMRPTSVTGIQPPTGREEMIYPVTSPVTVTDGSNGGSPQASSLESVSLQSSSLGNGYAASALPTNYDEEKALMSLAPPGFPILNLELEQRSAGALPDNQDRIPSLNFCPPQRSTPVKRGPFKDQDQREKTALTRKIGSCIRCRMQRIRCNLDPENKRGPCLSCKKIAMNTRVYRLNCLRWKITDVRLFKPGQVKGQEWTRRWQDNVMEEIATWESSEIRTIHVTEGYTGQSVRLRVRQFKPLPGDSLERSWVSNGVKKRVKIPPYAIVNMEEARAAFDRYIKNHMYECCNNLVASRDPFLWKTYALAIDMAKDQSTPPAEKSLLSATLDLWMSVRLTTKSFEIVGEDTLGMPRNIIDDEANPLYGKIPLPPVMGAQIDSVLIHQIQPRLRRRTLEELQKMTQEKKQKTWLTTYLVTFILLHNIALITKHDAEYAKKHDLKRRFAREETVKEYNIGANTLLAYYHYCNKAVYPFSPECKDQDLQSLAELDDNGLDFVRYTRRIVAEHKKEWAQLWESNAYENEYYYVSQLYEQSWQPRTMV